MGFIIILLNLILQSLLFLVYHTKIRMSREKENFKQKSEEQIRNSYLLLLFLIRYRLARNPIICSVFGELESVSIRLH